MSSVETTATPAKAYAFTDPQWASARQTAMSALRAHLPESIAVLRRLQFGRFLAASTIVTNLPVLPLPGGGGAEDSACAPGGPRQGGPQGPQSPWMVAFVDRSTRPETEAWMYGDWEKEAAVEEEDASGCRAQDDETIAARQNELMESFVTAMRGQKLPDSIHEDFVPEYHAHLVNTIKFGGIHEKTLRVLERTGLLYLRTGLRDMNFAPFSTYIFDIDTILARSRVTGKSSQDDDLAPGMYWKHLELADMALVRERQEYARKDKTLMAMPNAAIFSETDIPIAWALVGLDGSLTSLHVEEEWRRRGLARVVTRKVFAEGMERFRTPETHSTSGRHLAQAYVHKKNQASRRLCEGLGGSMQWDVFWVSITLGEKEFL